MNRILTATRGIDSWRQRLASPDRQWRRGCSAFETAVSWEFAQQTAHGLPQPIGSLFSNSGYEPAHLIQAIAEHKVPLPGGPADSQCDVWAILNTTKGLLSLSVEAKAQEPFGDATLKQWFADATSPRSSQNRQDRWEFIRSHLPQMTGADDIRYQLLHRCAASIIEAKRFSLRHAVFVVQAFGAPQSSFTDFELFCRAIHVEAARSRLVETCVGDISLAIGWADCPFASDADVAATASVQNETPE